MSYILDALRKSHRDREQSTESALRALDDSVQRVARRSRSVLAVGVSLLAVNAVLLGWLALRQSSTPPVSVSAPPAAVVAPTVSQQAVTSSVPVTTPESAPAVDAVSVPPAQSRAAVVGVERVDVNDATLVARDMSMEREFDLRRRAGGRDAMLGTDSGDETGLDPSAREPRRDAAVETPSTRAATAEESIPVFAEASAALRARYPLLTLDVHVFSPEPHERFVFINMAKYHEGDVTKDGLRVERIVADGVVLSGSGERFLLTAQ